MGRAASRLRLAARTLVAAARRDVLVPRFMVRTLPMPARYVIGQDGRVRYAEVSPDYTQRPDPDELLPVLARTTVGA